ncbi:hypothetical protein D3C86_871550 [compost metagenome]
MPSAFPISFEVSPRMTCAATSRSRGVSSAFTARRDPRSSKVQMPASCGAARFIAWPVTWHQKVSPASAPCSPPRRFIMRLSA